MSVPDPAASRAVLVGVGAYAKLPSLPAAETGAARLAALLREREVWGLPARNVSVLPPDAAAERILGAVRDAASETTDTLVVYFAGHGLRDRKEQLFLALAGADEDYPQIGTLPYRSLRDVVRQVGYRARYRVTLLDCCYSGLAGNMSGSATPTRPELARALGERESVEGDGDPGGAYGDCVLTSAPATQRSFVPAGAEFPEFTGELIRLLERGIANSRSTVSLDEVWRIARDRLHSRASPEPQQFAQNAVTSRIHFRNRGGTGRDTTGEDAHPVVRRAGKPVARTSRRNFLIGVTGAGALAGLGFAGWEVYGRRADAVEDRGTGAVPGHEKWTFRTARPVSSSPAVAHGVVYVGCDDDKLYALEAATGKRRWDVPTGGYVRASPVVADGVVYFGSNDGNLYAVGAGDGKRRWRPFGAGGSLGWSSPAISGGLVYSGSDDGTLHAVDAATGKQKWKATTGSTNSIPSAVDGTVCVSSERTLYAFDAESGERRWRFVTDHGVWSPTLAGRTVYAGGGDGNLYAVDVRSGEPAWPEPYRVGAVVPSKPAVADGVVYVGSQNGHLYAVDAGTGKPLWKSPVGGEVKTTPAVSGGVVYVSSGDGGLYAFDAADGRRRWRLTVGGFLYSSPAVADGVVYVGSDLGKLYAVHG